MNTTNYIDLLFCYDPHICKYIFIYKYHSFPALQEKFIPLREQFMIEHVNGLLKNVNYDFDKYVKENPDQPVVLSYNIVREACGEAMGSFEESINLMIDFSSVNNGPYGIEKKPVLLIIWKCLHMLLLFRKFNITKLIFRPIETLIEFFLDPFNEKEFGLVIRLAKKIVLAIWNDNKYLRNSDKVWLFKIFYYSIKKGDPFYDWCLHQLEEWLRKNPDIRKRF